MTTRKFGLHLFRYTVIPLSVTSILISQRRIVCSDAHEGNTYYEKVSNRQKEIEEERQAREIEEKEKWDQIKKEREEERRLRNEKWKLELQKREERFPINSYWQVRKIIPKWIKQVHQEVMKGDEGIFSERLKYISDRIEKGCSNTKYILVWYDDDIYETSDEKLQKIFYPTGIDYNTFNWCVWWNKNKFAIKINDPQHKFDGWTIRFDNEHWPIGSSFGVILTLD